MSMYSESQGASYIVYATLRKKRRAQPDLDFPPADEYKNYVKKWNLETFKW